MIKTDVPVELILVKDGGLVNGVQIIDNTGKFDIEAVEDDIGSHDVIFEASYDSEIGQLYVDITVKVTINSPKFPDEAIAKEEEEEKEKEKEKDKLKAAADETKYKSVVDSIVD